MSVEHETKSTDLAAVTPQSLDLTGLPFPVADELRRLVATLRSNLGRVPSPEMKHPDDWNRRLQAWVDSHPPRLVAIDDSREGIYGGRGE
jgi:hypothetical protein